MLGCNARHIAISSPPNHTRTTLREDERRNATVQHGAGELLLTCFFHSEEEKRREEKRREAHVTSCAMTVVMVWHPGGVQVLDLKGTSNLGMSSRIQ